MTRRTDDEHYAAMNWQCCIWAFTVQYSPETGLLHHDILTVCSLLLIALKSFKQRYSPMSDTFDSCCVIKLKVFSSSSDLWHGLEDLQRAVVLVFACVYTPKDCCSLQLFLWSNGNMINTHCYRLCAVYAAVSFLLAQVKTSAYATGHGVDLPFQLWDTAVAFGALYSDASWVHSWLVSIVRWVKRVGRS